MKIEQEIVNKYITEDGEVFFDVLSAFEHEYEIIRNRLYDSSIRIGEYTIYKINEQDELDAIKYDEYGKRTFDLPMELNFPIFLCETSDDDCYYFYYKLLDDVIYSQIQLLDKLKAIK